MESVRELFKSDTFESDTIVVTFEIFGKYSESVGFDDNNDLPTRRFENFQK